MNEWFMHVSNCWTGIWNEWKVEWNVNVSLGVARLAQSMVELLYLVYLYSYWNEHERLKNTQY